MKKLLLCTAIAASLGLYGCGGGEELTEVQAQTPVERPFARIVFAPPDPALTPLPNDAVMIPSTSLFDFTIESENQANFDNRNPLDAVGSVDGWSLQSPFVINMDLPTGLSIDANSLNDPAAIRIFEAVQALEGDTPECQALAAASPAPGLPCGVTGELTRGVDFMTVLSDADTITVLPLRPFKPAQGHLLVVTQALLDSQGRGVRGSTTWDLAIQDINEFPLATEDQLQLQAIGNLLVATAAAVGIPVEQNSYTAYFSTQSAGTVTGTVKNLQIGGFAQALSTLLAQGVDLPTAQAQAATFLPAIVVNQSPMGNTLYDVFGAGALGEETVAALAAVGITDCASMLPVLADPTNPLYPTAAQVYAGVAPLCATGLAAGQIDLPYYHDPLVPIDGYWTGACTSGSALAAIEGANPGTVAQLLASGPAAEGGAVGPNNELCQAASGGSLYDLNLAAIGINDRRNLTKVQPIPQRKGRNPDGTETLDVFISVPNEAAIAAAALVRDDIEAITKPEAGWPVVVYQHGITVNKESALAIISDFALKGFAVVAIDHPVHGSRGFEIDGEIINATSGTCNEQGSCGELGDYNNLASLLSGRDNLRQSIVDTMGLRLGLNAWVDLTGTADIDPNNVSFLGMSLGAITGVGTVATSNTTLGGDLAAFDPMFRFNSAVFNVVGGSITQILLSSPEFSTQVLATVLVGSSPEFEAFVNAYREENDLNFEQAIIPAYLEFAPTLTPEQQAKFEADTSLFAFAAQTAIDSGDPISYAARAAATTPVLLQGVVGGGTNDDGTVAVSDSVVPISTPGPLGGMDGIARSMGLFDGVSSTTTSEDSVSGYVRFNAGDHGSLLSDNASAAATAEMRRQIITFFQSQGRTIEITDDTVVAN